MNDLLNKFKKITLSLCLILISSCLSHAIQWEEKVELVVDGEYFTTYDIEQYGTIYRLAENRALAKEQVKELLAWDTMKAHYANIMGVVLSEQEKAQAIQVLLEKNKAESKEAFEQKLAGMGVNAKLWWKMALNNYAYEHVLQNIRAKVVLEEGDVEAYEQMLQEQNATVTFMDYKMADVEDEEQMIEAIIAHASSFDHDDQNNQETEQDLLLDNKQVSLRIYAKKSIDKVPSLFANRLVGLNQNQKYSEVFQAPNGKHMLVWVRQNKGELNIDQTKLFNDALNRKQNSKIAKHEVELRNAMFVDYIHTHDGQIEEGTEENPEQS